MKKTILLKNGYDLDLQLVNCDIVKIDNYYYYDLTTNILKENYNDTTETVDFLSDKDKKQIKKEALQLLLEIYQEIRQDNFTAKKIEQIKRYLKEN